MVFSVKLELAELVVSINLLDFLVAATLYQNAPTRNQFIRRSNNLKCLVQYFTAGNIGPTNLLIVHLLYMLP